MDKPPKRRLYELYWGKHKDFKDISAAYDVRAERVGEWFRADGIPHAPNHNRDAFIFAMRSKRYYYELYWGERLDYADIASKLGLGMSFVGEQIRATDVPTRDDPYPTRDPDEIPQRYEWPDAEPATLNSDDPTADLPDDPDGSKYMADTNGEFDKERLYELHWGYGCSAKHVAAILDVAPQTLRDRLRNRDIPIRDWHSHTEWEPHHGVPPKYEWKHDRDVDEDEPSVQNGIWRQATAATSD